MRSTFIFLITSLSLAFIEYFYLLIDQISLLCAELLLNYSTFLSYP